MAEEAEHRGFAYSVMLVLSITFQMSVFYLVNSSDKDICAYAYDIIGNTILIFCGVLLFFATHNLTVTYVIDAFPEHPLAILFGQFLLWLCFLEFIISWFAGLFTNRDKLRQRRINDEFTNHTAVYYLSSRIRWEPCRDKEHVDMVRDRNMECFGKMFGHVTAFAAIRTFGWLQHTPPLNQTPLSAFGASCMAFVGILVLYRLFWFVRKAIRKIFFHHKKEEAEAVHELIVDVENDVCGLACSFLAYLACRFHLTGKLPSIEGAVVATPEVAGVELWYALGIGVFWLVPAAGTLVWQIRGGWQAEEYKEWELFRLSQVWLNFTTMSVAWFALLFWKLVVRWMNWFPDLEEIQAKIFIAYFISIAGFSWVYVLDTVDDKLRDKLGEMMFDVDPLEKFVLALGLGIGFAWEQSFDTACDDTADKLRELFNLPATSKVWLTLLLCLLLILIVLPAYRLFIMRLQIAADEEQAAEHEAQREELKKSSNTLESVSTPRTPRSALAKVSNDIDEFSRSCSSAADLIKDIDARIAALEKIATPKEQYRSLAEPFLDTGAQNP